MSNGPSGAKIRAIVKRPDERYGHVSNISDTLKNLQRTVEGPIEIVRIGDSMVCICNEEGKLKGLERNFKLGEWPFSDIIVGTAIITGTAGGELCDCPIDIKTWKKLLGKWGNL